MSSLPADVESALRDLLAVVQSSSKEQLLATCVATAVPQHNSQVDAVAVFLYTNWYSFAGAKGNQPNVTLGRDNLTAALRASIAASTQWQNGWVVLQAAVDGACLAGHQNQSRELRTGEYVNVSRPGLPVMPGDAIAAVQCIDWVDPNSGWWCLQSAIGHPAEPLLRLYWSVDHDHVGVVLAELTSVLDSQQVRYFLKCPSRVSEYRRVDSLIVYIERSRWSELASLIGDSVNHVADCLRKQCPPLTQKIAPGVALAEDPGTKQSFGESRCRALAPAVVSILQNPSVSGAEALNLLVEALRSAGVDPVQPWRHLQNV